jgi:uncharacterized membrane protein YqjE
MTKDQTANPPEHANTAPAGEIRPEPKSTLRLFSVLIAVALALPAIALIVGGFEANRVSFEIVGFVLLFVIGIAYFVILWRIMKSRSD